MTKQSPGPVPRQSAALRLQALDSATSFSHCSGAESNPGSGVADGWGVTVGGGAWKPSPPEGLPRNRTTAIS